MGFLGGSGFHIVPWFLWGESGFNVVIRVSSETVVAWCDVGFMGRKWFQCRDVGFLGESGFHIVTCVSWPKGEIVVCLL